MRALIINRGVQPETIQTAIAFFENESLDSYITSSSFGYDHFFSKYLKQKHPNAKITKYLLRRVIAIPESKIKRNYLIFEIVARLMPFQKLSFLMRQLNDFLLKKKAAKLLLVEKSNLVISQDSFGLALLNALKMTNSIGILTVSAAPPQVFNEIFEIERSRNPEWFSFYPKNLYTQRFINNYVRDVNSASIVTAPSTFVVEQISRFTKPNKVKIIQLGYFREDLGVQFSDVINRKERVDSSQPLKCLYIGQVQQRKGIGYLLKGFEEAHLPSGSSVTLAGSIDKKLKNFITARYDFVKVLGHKSRSDLGSLFRTHDVFIFPSLLEGFALSVIEALSSGIPVIATQIALGDLIIDKHNGLIISSGSSESITKAIEWFNQNPIKISAIRKNGIKTASQYGWNRYKKEFIDLANSLSNEK